MSRGRKVRSKISVWSPEKRVRDGGRSQLVDLLQSCGLDRVFGFGGAKGEVKISS